MEPGQMQEVDAGFDLVSFDDPETESILAGEEPQKEGDKEDEKDINAEFNAKEKERQEAKKPKQKKKEKEKDEKISAAKKEKGEGEGEPDQEGEEVPLVKAKDGTEIPANTVFVKKVDGEKVEVKLDELLDNYSGKVAIHKRFNDANQIKLQAEAKEKEITQKLNEATKSINDFFEYSEKGMMPDALEALCRFTGQDFNEQMQRLERIQSEQRKAMSELSEEQLAQKKLEEENAYLRRKWEREQNKSTSEQDEITKAEQEIKAESERWGIERSNVEAGYRMLVDLKEKGQYNGPIDVKSSAEAGFDIKTWGLIDGFVRSNLSEFSGDNAFYSEILRDTKEHQLTEADWTELLDDLQSEITEEQSSSKLKKKLAKGKKSPPKPSKDEEADLEEDEEELVSFDEI